MEAAACASAMATVVLPSFGTDEVIASERTCLSIDANRIFASRDFAAFCMRAPSATFLLLAILSTTLHFGHTTDDGDTQKLFDLIGGTNLGIEHVCNNDDGNSEK